MTFISKLSKTKVKSIESNRTNNYTYKLFNFQFSFNFICYFIFKVELELNLKKRWLLINHPVKLRLTALKKEKIMISA